MSGLARVIRGHMVTAYGREQRERYHIQLFRACSNQLCCRFQYRGAGGCSQYVTQYGCDFRTVR